MTLTTPIWETVGHVEVSSSGSQPMQKFEDCSFNLSEDISYDVKF